METNIILNLIIDGNYLLFKTSLYLHKNNLLYGGLAKSLETSIINYKKLFPFANIYLVSDSKEMSWRKKLYKQYKENRKKDEKIDWEFIFKTYTEFKNESRFRGIKIMESPGIEGDDFISYISVRANEKLQSNMIISNDSDIKQILKFNKDGLYMNFMVNELFKKRVCFFPKDYKIFLDKLKNIDNSQDLFNLNDNVDFMNLLTDFSEKSEVMEVDPTETLIIKLISGDKGDNIKSSFYTMSSGGAKRGIGKAGAQTIVENYIKEFGELNMDDPDLMENISDLICEKKKVSKTTIGKIKHNLLGNQKLIDLNINNIPAEIVEKMKIIYEKYHV